MKVFENPGEYGVTIENKSERLSSFYIIANISFFLYMFFTIYGTSLPFQEHIQDVDEIGTSNIINQIVFSVLFLTSIFALIPKWQFVISLIRKEKLFFIFILWCSLTLFWSDYPFISFKRLFQYITTYTVFLAVLAHIRSADDIFKYFKFLLTAYVFVSLVSIPVVPGAKEDFGAWRGLAASKNHLGQMSLISILFFTHFITISSLKQKIFFAVMLIMALILFIGSSSVTSLLTLLLIIGLLAAQYFDKQFAPARLGRSVSVVTGVFVVIFIALLLFLAPTLLSEIVGETGKNLTLTGRTDLWHDVYQYAKTHLLLGCGFQGFWVMDSMQMQELYQTYIWIPFQAHNGYLDILNETGLIGLFLFLATAVNYFVNLRRMKNGYFWKWLVIAALVVNLTESTLIRPNIPNGVLYTFSYLALFTTINYGEIDGDEKK